MLRQLGENPELLAFRKSLSSSCMVASCQTRPTRFLVNCDLSLKASLGCEHLGGDCQSSFAGGQDA
jgi:hypothetical protein